MLVAGSPCWEWRERTACAAQCWPLILPHLQPGPITSCSPPTPSIIHSVTYSHLCHSLSSLSHTHTHTPFVTSLSTDPLRGKEGYTKHIHQDLGVVTQYMDIPKTGIPVNTLKLQSSSASGCTRVINQRKDVYSSACHTVHLTKQYKADV